MMQPAHRISRLLGLLTLLVVLSLISRAADTVESEHAFNVASQAFRDELWDRAEGAFEAFVAQFPDSSHVSEAILLQAQSRFQSKRYEAAIELLTTKLNLAGAKADHFRYWIAEAQFQKGNFGAAAHAYAAMLKESPNSPLRLKASYGEAFAHFKLADFARSIELLQKPDGHFQQAAQNVSGDATAVHGHLLLAEALYEQKNYPAAAEVLNQLASSRKPSPELEWQRLYLLTMVELAAQKPDVALSYTTNLLAIATALGKPLLQGSALKLQAEILEPQRPEAAIAAYDRIAQIKNLPIEQARQAVLKSVHLSVGQNRLTEAIQRLGAYMQLTNNLADPALDLLRLTLGELHLKHYYQLSRGSTNQGGTLVDTNSIHRARLQFDLLITTFTNSPLAGKAYLNRGWCLWEETQAPRGETKLPECLAAFQSAVERLTNSEDQAVARFKWADCQFLQRNFTNALENYRTLLTSYENVPPVKAKWFDQALYQIIRASIEIGDLTGARAALDRILTEFSTSSVADDSMIDFGQALLDQNLSSGARAIFSEFQKKFPESPLRPEADSGIARSYAQEADWMAATSHYDRWITTYTNHRAWPQTEFERALVYSKAGNETNALALFRNLAARFPASRLAPLAQLWVGDYYFSQGKFEDAELSYKQKVLLQNTNAPAPDLAQQAKLMAARAAFSRQGYNDARSQVTNLISEVRADGNAAPHLLPEAYLLWGMIDLNEPTAPDVSPFAKFDSAISKFRQIRGGSLEPRARCLIGYCYLQLGSTDAQHYANALDELQKVIDPPLAALADIGARSQAEYLLASVLEKQAKEPGQSEDGQKKLLRRALDHYLNVVHGNRLRPEQKEQPDMHWVNRAGLNAGSLAEQLHLYREARRIYERLRVTFPLSQERWNKKIETLPMEARE